MFTVEEIKEFAKNDPKFEENTENWEELFILVEKGVTNNDENFKEKYEELKEKYISRFEQPAEEIKEKKVEVTENDDLEKIKIDDILKEE